MGRAMIVSAGVQSNAYLAARLTELGWPRPVMAASGAEARRRMLEGGFELVVVNAPLPDEVGSRLCLDAAEQSDAGVIFLAKAALCEELADLQICIEMLEAAGYHGDPAIADVKRQRMVQRLDEAGK